MKKSYTSLLLLLCLVLFFVYFFQNNTQKKDSNQSVQNTTNTTKFKDGDLIFQTSLSSQSLAIQIATKSEYSHCGIVCTINGKLSVYEAVEPVKLTPLDKWIARGKDSKYVLKRLKNAEELLTPEVKTKMLEVGKSFMNKSYDLYFEWSDDKIYCSELIWKIYKRGVNVEVGKLEKLGDFDLSNNEVKLKLKERYGDNIPLEEVVISPAGIFNSDLLITIE